MASVFQDILTGSPISRQDSPYKGKNIFVNLMFEIKGEDQDKLPVNTKQRIIQIIKCFKRLPVKLNMPNL